MAWGARESSRLKEAGPHGRRALDRRERTAPRLQPQLLDPAAGLQPLRPSAPSLLGEGREHPVADALPGLG